MSWILLALLGALFTSLTTIFTKIGLKNVNSDFATLYRTGIVIVFSMLLCFLSHSFVQLSVLTKKNWLFLILSGIATGCSWLCYNRALKDGNVSQVVSIDKSSFILTNILFLIFFFDATTNHKNPLTIIMLFLSSSLMLIGTLLMVKKGKEEQTNNKKWLLFAILSSVFAAFVSLFVKLGLQGINSHLGTFIRTIIVFIFAIFLLFFKKSNVSIKKINWKDWLFLTLSGLATGCAWIFEYSALNHEFANPATVQAIGKLSILLTMLFSVIILKEKFTKKSWFGLSFLVLGILVITLFSL